jgi:hypothetical protein
MRWSGRPRQPTGWGRRSWSAERCPGGDSSPLPANGSRRSARAPAHVRGHIAFLSSLLGQGCGCFPAGSCGLQLLHPVAAGLALQGGSIEETPGLPPRHSTVRSVAVACSPAISPVRLVKKTASRVRTTPAASWTGGFARSRPQAHGFSLQHRVGEGAGMDRDGGMRFLPRRHRPQQRQKGRSIARSACSPQDQRRRARNRRPESLLETGRNACAGRPGSLIALDRGPGLAQGPGTRSR